MAVATYSLNQSSTTLQDRAFDNIKKKVKELSTRHPAAKFIMGLVCVLIVIAAAYTGYHNWRLVCRIVENKALAAFPALLMDGSLLLIPAAFIFWFTDGTQKLMAGVFEVVLFIIVGINTALDGSYAPHDVVSEGARLYISVFVTVSFLLVLAGWLLILHNDPIIKRHEEMAGKNAEAEQLAHDLEIEKMKDSLNRQQSDFEHQAALFGAMHSARMKALESDEVQTALIDFEKGHAINEAQRIRGSLPLPKAQSQQ
jgi:hypothetical protein